MQKESSPLTTSDGREAIRGSLHIEIREPSSLAAQGEGSSEPILEFIASDESLDRYDEVICASGWKLTNYQKNPVFQNNHQTGDIIHTLGRALLTEVRIMGDREVLYQRIKFATEANPIARIAYGLYKG